jgi:HEAT repeat protein
MTGEDSFRARLRAVIDNIAAPGRPQTQALVDGLVQAGVASDGALLDLVRDRRVADGLRADGCWLLGRLAIRGGTEVLVELLGDASVDVRAEAAASLGLLGTPDGPVADALVEAVVHDAATPVRAAAIHALGILGGSSAAPTLLALVEDQSADAELRADAAEACAHMTDIGIVDVLLDALDDASPLVRYSAAYSLGQQGDANAIARLEELAAHDEAVTPWGTVASSAAQALEALAQRGS